MNPEKVPTAMSEASAEAGCVLVDGQHRDYRLSDAVAWREGDIFVIRSSEFDVMAEDEDFRKAVNLFVRRLIDYGSALHDLVETGRATPDEETAFNDLAGRFFPLVEAAQRDQPRVPRWPPRRRRGSGSGHWRHRGTQASASGQLSGV